MEEINNILKHAKSSTDQIPGFALVVIPRTKFRTWGKALFWGKNDSLPLSQIENLEQIYIAGDGYHVKMHVKTWLIDLNGLRKYVVKSENKNEYKPLNTK